MSNQIGLYIHIPFCKSKCPYCDFYSNRATDSDYEKYTEILIQKIIMWSKKISKNIATVYVGGGTPSVIGTDRLCRITDCIMQNFNVMENAEITVEINPESGKKLDFSKMHTHGINRISVGLQSADTSELKALGRIHTAEDAKMTVALAKKSGITNISLDLMLGIPHQTLESVKKSVLFCNECGVKHISAYILKVEPGTGFDKIKSKLVLPGEDMQSKIYLNTVKTLDLLGYKQYEISNFAKAGFESKHNLNYWDCGEYLGIGPAAHSFIDGKRFYYGRNMDDFANDKTIFDCNGGDAEEFIILSLRTTSGLDLNEYKKRFNKEISQSFLQKINEFTKFGFVIVKDNKISLTPSGFLVSNTIISDLI